MTEHAHFDDRSQRSAEELAKINEQIAQRRGDGEFQARLKRRLNEDAAVLERLGR